MGRPVTIADHVDLAHVPGALTDRAYLLLAARWRRARPRQSFGAWAEAQLLAALDRAAVERSRLLCLTCATVTDHAHEADVPDELARQVARMWRCSACDSVRQCGALELEAA